MDHAAAIDTLLAGIPHLWRGREPNRHQRTLATGHGRLDAYLPGGGWPVGAVTELITNQPGLGEFSLLFPALAEISHNGQWLILVDPPWIPYPAALQGHGLALERLLLVRTDSTRESLWACEQALHGIQGGAVLAWPEQASFARLRRLQLAAEANAKLAFLFRPEQVLTSASPCALRLHLQGATQKNAWDNARDNARGTRIDIIKCRGKCHGKYRSIQSGESAWIPHVYTRKQPYSDLKRFSHYDKQQFHTEGHASPAQYYRDTPLAGFAPATSGTGWVHPRPCQAGFAACGQHHRATT